MVERALSEWANAFQRVSNLVAPAVDGGILNYAFEPVSVDNVTLLKVPDVSSIDWLSLLRNVLVSSSQDLRVYEVLQPDVDPTGIKADEVRSKHRQVLVMLILCCLILVLAFMFSLATTCISCCCWSHSCCSCRGRGRRGNTRGYTAQPRGNLNDLTRRDNLSIGPVRAPLHQVNATPLATFVGQNDTLQSTSTISSYANMNVSFMVNCTLHETFVVGNHCSKCKSNTM